MLPLHIKHYVTLANVRCVLVIGILRIKMDDYEDAGWMNMLRLALWILNFSFDLFFKVLNCFVRLIIWLYWNLFCCNFHKDHSLYVCKLKDTKNPLWIEDIKYKTRDYRTWKQCFVPQVLIGCIKFIDDLRFASRGR